MQTIKSLSIVVIVLLIGLVIYRKEASFPEKDSVTQLQSTTTSVSLYYPEGYEVDEDYVYEALGPGNEIKGVKFSIPPSLATGTNLSLDTYVSLEKIENASSCAASLFLRKDISFIETPLRVGGILYSFASTTGAAAGNRYEEYVYAQEGSSPCTAVRYFIHYGSIENYADDTRVFDKNALLLNFAQIRDRIIVP